MTTNGTRRAGWRGFGVAGALPHEVIRTLAVAAEAAGYHTFWVNDTPHGDGLASLRAAADVTSEILLGVGVIPLDRQPADVIARRVEELGLPQQRLIVGIGSGSQQGGLARVREGAATLEERLEAPIVIGALGPNMCAMAGRSSDGVLLNWLTAEYVAPSAAIVTAAAREAGRYGGYPAYAANFTRMGTPAEATAVIGDSAAEIQAGLASFASELDETVVRAITGEESADAYMALLEAATPD